MANRTFRAAASGGDNSFTSNTIVATVPTGTLQNDGGGIWYTSGALAPTAAPTHTTPSGWTERHTAVFNGLAGGLLNVRLTVYDRIEPATPVSATLTSSANAAHTWTRESDSDVDTAGQFGQCISGAHASGTSVVASSITTTKANASIKMFVSQGAAQTATPDGSLTERSDNGTYGVSLADAIQATAGATGTKTATLPGATDGLWAFGEWWSEVIPQRDEVVTLSDAQSSQLVTTGTRGETVTLSDTQVAQASFASTRDEAVTLTDGQTGNLTVAGQVNEAFTVADDQSSVIAISGSVSETFSVSDAQSAQSDLAATRGEAFALADGQASQADVVGARGEAFALSDGQTSALIISAQRDEAFTLADDQTGIIANNTVVDGFVLSDNQTATGSFNISLGESFTLTDSQTASGGQSDVISATPGHIRPLARQWRGETPEEKKKRWALIEAEPIEPEPIKPDPRPLKVATLESQVAKLKAEAAKYEAIARRQREALQAATAKEKLTAMYAELEKQASAAQAEAQAQLDAMNEAIEVQDVLYVMSVMSAD